MKNWKVKRKLNSPRISFWIGEFVFWKFSNNFQIKCRWLEAESHPLLYYFIVPFLALITLMPKKFGRGLIFKLKWKYVRCIQVSIKYVLMMLNLYHTHYNSYYLCFRLFLFSKVKINVSTKLTAFYSVHEKMILKD